MIRDECSDYYDNRDITNNFFEENNMQIYKMDMIAICYPHSHRRYGKKYCIGIFETIGELCSKDLFESGMESFNKIKTILEMNKSRGIIKKFEFMTIPTNCNCYT